MRAVQRVALWAVAGFSSVALAQPSLPPGWYVGAGGGASNSQLKYDGVHRVLEANGTSAVISDDDQDQAWHWFLGWKANPWLSLEAGWFDLGDFNVRTQSTPAGQRDGSVRVRGLNLDVLGQMPLAGRWSALARVGAHYDRARTTEFGSGALAGERSGNHYGWSPKVGLGLQYDVSPVMAARADWTHYRFRDNVYGNNAVTTWTASLLVSFGTPAVAAPAPVEPMSEPQPAAADPTPAPAPGPSLKATSYTEQSLFGFDSAALSPAGRQTLDGLVTEVKPMPYARITVTGHASRTGPDDYNWRLSQRRAEAVRDYLVQQGLDAGRIQVQAKGETEPVTQPGECAGKDERNDPQLQKCLQPDRRVKVEVTGEAPASTVTPAPASL